jgi:hypothetical protein
VNVGVARFLADAGIFIGRSRGKPGVAPEGGEGPLQ